MRAERARWGDDRESTVELLDPFMDRLVLPHGDSIGAHREKAPDDCAEYEEQDREKEDRLHGKPLSV